MGVASVTAGLRRSMVTVALMVVAVPAVAQYPLAEGLELERYDSASRTIHADGDVHVLRIDPLHWRLDVFTTGAEDRVRRRLDQWGEVLGLAAVINAGMYQADGRTHVGFCQVDGEVLNGAPNHYQSAFVCDPVDPEDPEFAIVDLDEVPLKQLRQEYRTVVQNLRLIKHDGRNRWSPSRKRWREAALAEDREGRALFILCTRALSMHDFNELVLALPLDLVAAQHLEGNATAGLWVGLLPSGYASGIAATGKVPNVLGIRPRAEGTTAE